jgi:hypothetical protein
MELVQSIRKFKQQVLTKINHIPFYITVFELIRTGSKNQEVFQKNTTSCLAYRRVRSRN